MALSELRKIANTTHNASGSLYTLYVFLKRSGFNIDNKYQSIDYLARDISDCMRGVKYTIDMLERYNNGNPHKCSREYVLEGVGITIRNLNSLWRKLPNFKFINEFDEYNNVFNDCRDMLLAFEDIKEELAPSKIIYMSKGIPL